MITIWVPKRLVEIDLYNVAARSPQALADLSEQSYAQRVDYAAQKVQLSGAKIVMLTGPSASGKTTSAHWRWSPSTCRAVYASWRASMR